MKPYFFASFTTSSKNHGSTVTVDDLAAAETRAALLVHLTTRYLDQSSQLDIPYVDLAI